MKFSKNDNILSKGNKKEHTIIIKRNASVRLDKKRNNKFEEKEEKNNVNKNMHYSLRKINKDKNYLKYKNNLIKKVIIILM